ncbi:MAG TPA: AAA family ATPase [Anaerolineae bacterium]|nr:AAA family ATPase [Anaerolineae bacterium]HOR01350.1 AAA family ATPase [Anaerolineae bacterium]HPL28003.1 AAA family ATPase [Anaerolineae bacterium]
MSSAAQADFRARLLAGQPLDLQAFRPLMAERFPELATLAGVAAGCGEGHLAEDALQHTQQVLARLQPLLAGLAPEEAQALYLAGLLHDVGRSPLAGPAQRRSSHEQAGAALAREALFRLQLAGPLRDHVVYLVRQHALPAAFGGREAALPRMLRLAWTLNTRLLDLLARADLGDAGTAAAQRHAARIAAFEARCRELGVFGREPPPLVAPRRWRALAPRDPLLCRRLAGELRFWRLKGRIATTQDAEAWLAEQRPQPAGTLYLPVGVPGSGKSTWVAREAPQARLVSMDEMRERLTGNSLDQSRNADVFRRCRRELAQALRAGETVVWDAQSHTWSSRQGLLALARETHAYVIIVYFDVPLALSLERNRKRAAMVPEAVIVRSYRDLQEPRPFEAEEMWRVDADGECTRYPADEAAGA